ncbi:CLIP-associated protein [Zea mays]|uniref:CLIP-associated protein n=1 Tax=Zea mays TaxID=4577 RepID=A0A1D6J9Z1_MAIZE|nr:CLIP-associated protein [Zea mays]
MISSMQEPALHNVSIGRTVSDMSMDHAIQSLESSTGAEVHLTRGREPKNNSNLVAEAARSWTSYPEKTDASVDGETATGTPRLDFGRFITSDGHNTVGSTTEGSVQDGDMIVNLSSIKTSLQTDNGLSVPQLLHQISNGTEVSSSEKREALQQLVDASLDNNTSIWAKYFNQILTVVLEVLDDSDSSMRELALSLIAEMLNNQKDAIEDSTEIVLEKLLHVTKDAVAKVIVPLLVSDDEKILVVCINCLTKLVGRLSQEELIDKLPTFLPALFDAFNNQSPDVRKTVVFCLVDMYIMLGKAFAPYLEGLSSTQLRLVTIYANRISQARSGKPIDSNQ